MARRRLRFLPLAVAAAVLSACSASSSGSDGGAGGAQSSPGTPVEVGIPVPTNFAALSALFGGAAGSNGSQFPTDAQAKAMYQSVVDYVNSHGGLLGHKITPVFFGMDVTKSTGTATEQQMCTQFTQDHHVFAVIAPANHTETLVSCLQDAGVITLDPPGFIGEDDTFFDQNSLYATAGALSLTRVAAVEVNGLFDAGYFGSNAKIGLVGYNTEPYTRTIDAVLKPALANHGLKLSDQELVKPVSGVADVGPTQEAIGGAVLRFKEEGIDHVLFLDTQGGTVQPWTTAASAQKYYPRLGFTTNQNPANRSYAGNPLDKDQVNQFSTALAVGWDTQLDVYNPTTNPTGTLCNSVMESSGLGAAQVKRFWGTCDQLLVLSAGVNAGGQLSASAALAGLAKAKNLQSAELLGPPSYAGGRRDGVAVAKILSFASSCECFQYGTTTVKPSAFSAS